MLPKSLSALLPAVFQIPLLTLPKSAKYALQTVTDVQAPPSALLASLYTLNPLLYARHVQSAHSDLTTRKDVSTVQSTVPNALIPQPVQNARLTSSLRVLHANLLVLSLTSRRLLMTAHRLVFYPLQLLKIVEQDSTALLVHPMNAKSA